jgi:hypothetical protein
VQLQVHGAGDGSQIDRVVALPFRIQRPQGDLLSQARQYYQEGRFSEAIIYLYSHLLVQLDKVQVIRLTPGKTNRQYVRETRSRSAAGDLLELTMVAFEDVYFGSHPLSRARFEACWNRLPELDQLLGHNSP